MNMNDVAQEYLVSFRFVKKRVRYTRSFAIIHLRLTSSLLDPLIVRTGFSKEEISEFNFKFAELAFVASAVSRVSIVTYVSIENLDLAKIPWNF